MRVLIVQETLRSYRVPLFDGLREELKARGVHLDVAHGRADSDQKRVGDVVDLTWAIPLTTRVVRVGRRRAVVLPLRQIASGYDLVIVEHAARNVSAIGLLFGSRRGRYRVAFWGHGANLQSDNSAGSRVIEAVKRFGARRPAWWFAYTPSSADIIIQAGFPAERITTLNNAIDTGWASSPDVQAARPVPGRCLYLGALRQDKGLDFVVQLGDELAATEPAFQLVVAGDGPERERLQVLARTRPWLTLCGYVEGVEKGVLLRESECVLAPDMVGLVAVDTIAARVPLVAWCEGQHSPEADYLVEGDNVLWVDERSVEAFSVAVKGVLHGRERFSFASEPPSLLAMVEAFSRGLISVLDETRNVRKKVVFLTNFLPPYRVPLMRELGRSVDLTVLTSVDMEANRTWHPTRGEVEVEVVRQRTLTREIRSRHAAGFSERRFIHIPYDTIARLWRLRPDVVISGELGFRSLMATIYCWLRPGATLAIWATLSERTEESRGQLTTRLRRVIASRADVIFVNGGSGHRYMAGLGAPAERIHVVPYSAAPAAGSRKLRALPEGPLRLLVVGQLIDRKGIGPLLTTLVGMSDVQLDIVGGGPQREELERQAAELGVVATFHGERSPAELSRLYLESSFLLFPTLADEWGLVVNEAMHAGLPVIGSAHSQAVEELVVDGVNGYSYSPEDRSSLTRALAAVRSLSGPEYLAMQNAAVAAVRHLTPEVVAEEMLRVVC